MCSKGDEQQSDVTMYKKQRNFASQKASLLDESTTRGVGKWTVGKWMVGKMVGWENGWLGKWENERTMCFWVTRHMLD